MKITCLLANTTWQRQELKYMAVAGKMFDLIIPETKGDVCEQCKKICTDADDLRPYGPGGTDICFDCAMKGEPETERQFLNQFKASVELAGYTPKQREQARRINELLGKIEAYLKKLRHNRLKLRANGAKPGNSKVKQLTSLISDFAKKRLVLKKQQAALRRKGGFGRKSQPTQRDPARAPVDTQAPNPAKKGQKPEGKEQPKPKAKPEQAPEKEKPDFEDERVPEKAPELPKNVDPADLDVMRPEDIDTALQIETDPKQKKTLLRYKKENNWRWAA